MSSSFPSRSGAIVLLIASLTGLAIALYAYFTPLTGVTGTLGALVAILACLALAILALLLASTQGPGTAIFLRILILLGLGGTGFAAVLLKRINQNTKRKKQQNK